MDILLLLFRSPSPELLPKPRTGFHAATEGQKYGVMLYFALLTLGAAFFFNSPGEIIQGLGRILTNPSILLSDYLVIGTIGSAFFNSALLMLCAILIARYHETTLSGPMIAAIFTVGGFAFFGKNLYNVWPIMGGVFLYARLRRESFKNVILLAYFGTALGPLVSQITFGFHLPLPLGLSLGVLSGLLAGLILPPLANHFIRFHQGYNLYNIGFTAGIVGMMFMSLFRAFNLQNTPTALVLEGHTAGLLIYLGVLFLSMLGIGFSFARTSWRNYRYLWQMPGQLVSDFIATDGFGLVLINMALLGFVSIGYVFLAGSSFSGPVMGGIFTVVGFAAFGKHLRNTIPIMLGVYLANQVFVWEASSVGSVLAALFATTLAPIAGAYGVIPGILAGFLHMALVMNVGYLHGGINLYNNGFSGGFVAAMLVPVLDFIISIKKFPREESDQ